MALYDNAPSCFADAMNRTKQALSVFLTALSIMVAVVMMIRESSESPPALQPALTESAEQHLLYGDKRGGGHMHGVGKACKSEFPADWDENEIISHVKAVAANDNLNWEQQNNGYHVAEQMVQDVRVKVVLNQDRTRIVTAYPTNVKRNPCPRPANDN